METTIRKVVLASMYGRFGNSKSSLQILLFPKLIDIHKTNAFSMLHGVVLQDCLAEIDKCRNEMELKDVQAKYNY